MFPRRLGAGVNLPQLSRVLFSCQDRKSESLSKTPTREFYGGNGGACKGGTQNKKRPNGALFILHLA